VLLTAAFPPDSACAGQRLPTEYEVKAAFIYNFAKFIEWPEGAFDGGGSDLKLCVLGNDPFGPALGAIEGKAVRGRKIKVRRVREAGKSRGCHFLFIGASEKNKLKSILKTLASSPAVTVSDMRGFAGAGGVVQFVMEEHKVRFIVNAAAAERAGLKISSKMLRLARKVIDDRAGTEKNGNPGSGDGRKI
jgi:hypothetical protein